MFKKGKVLTVAKINEEAATWHNLAREAAAWQGPSKRQ